ncbi:MAG: RsmB/NOP family class I SAM-dependent RNA methyltransferase, partial [Methylotenera sp.]|nr:RsmB/NOP family class I SAM-dependent RNA methyltransferase [Methylotenera sp.]
KRLNGKFDRVLVDAPCTGLGTLRRNPDLKWRQTPQDLAELTVKQANILARAAKLTKAGGRLIYSTCSLLSDENEQIAESFLASHPDYQLLNAAEILRQQQIDLDTGKYLKLLPHLHNTDGFFAAVFEKIDANAPVKKSMSVVTSDVKEPVEETVQEDQVTAKPKAKKTKVTEAAVEVMPTAKPAKAAKPKAEKVPKEKVVKVAVVKEKVVKEKVVKEKVAKPKVVKSKVTEE